jgi:CheY-like chemotaxis protein
MKQYIVLLVEDHQTFAKAAIKFLENKEEVKKIFHATNYAEAVKILEKEDVNLVISDVFFPEDSDKKVDLPLREKVLEEIQTKVYKLCLRSLERAGNPPSFDVLREISSNVGHFKVLENAIMPQQKLGEKEKPPKHYAPLGILITKEAREKGLPVVPTTSTHHHEKLTESVSLYCGQSSIRLVDAHSLTPREKANKRFWRKVWKKVGKFD